MNPNTWIDNYTDYLFSYALFKIGQREDAEDIVQETFFSAFKNKDTFKGDSSEKTWLVSILKNKIIDYYRKKSNERPIVDYINETEESFEASFFNDKNYGRWNEKIVDNYFSSSADSYLYSKEFQTYLDYCLNHLPPKLRNIFIAKYIDDENTEKICKDFEITSSNYWVMVFRSKTLLRTCLENKGIMP